MRYKTLPLPSTIIELAIPNPIAKWISPPGVSYERTCLSNSLECSINFSTSDVVGISISLDEELEHDIIKVHKRNVKSF